MEEPRSTTPSPFPAAPPAPPPVDPAEQSGQWQASTESVADRALRIGLENRASIGKPSIPATKQQASGLFLVVEDVARSVGSVGGDVSELRGDVKTIALSLAAKANVGERRATWLGMIGEKVITAVIPMVLVGIFAYLTGHLHWSAQATPPLVPSSTTPH